MVRIGRRNKLEERNDVIKTIAKGREMEYYEPEGYSVVDFA